VAETLTDDPSIQYLPSIDLCDPTDGVSPSVPIFNSTGGVGGLRRAVALGNDRILITGGRRPGQPWGSDNVTEIYVHDPASRKILPQPSLPGGIDRMALIRID
jgi:hypothetical protein